MAIHFRLMMEALNNYISRMQKLGLQGYNHQIINKSTYSTGILKL